MEKPTYTAIDYNSKENKVIEERIRNYYLPVKNVLETVRDRRINIPNSPGGLCVDLIGVSRTINIEFNLSNDGTYERIKREGEPELPPITFEEPKIYP